MDFDNAARARIARGWLNSSLDQSTYAAKNGIATRTLRQWVARYGAGNRPAAHARAIIESTIAQLQALSDALDAEEACHIGAEDAAGGGVGALDEEQRAASERPVVPAVAARTPAAPEPVRPLPMPGPGIFWC